jgi:pyridoxine kinase
MWACALLFPLPTVVLSNHAAYSDLAGLTIAPDMLDTMIQAVEANGWLSGTDVILTGYLPSKAHVLFAAMLIRRIRALNPALRYVCDPVLGDAPKGLYISQETAVQIRQFLLPLADVVTPNAFELSWLANAAIDNMTDADNAARALDCPMVLATSVPAPEGRLATLLQDTNGTVFTSVAPHPKAPSGTGDLLAGLFTGLIAGGYESRSALAYASARIEHVLTATGPSDDLALTSLYDPIGELSPLRVEAAT